MTGTVLLLHSKKPDTDLYLVFFFIIYNMENKRIIFTDIDGVLNVNYKKRWKKSCIELYNKITEELDLYPVITSTWRIPHNIDKLNEIFRIQGINRKILDSTILLQPSIRGLEILEYI